MSWLHPEYLWTLLLVPVVAALFGWAAWQRRRAASRFGDAVLVARLAAAVSTRRRRWKAALVVGAVACLAVALAGPRAGAQLREVTREGIDLVVALDVSASMQAEDVAPNRLERAKFEIKKLLDELRGDRVGLVVFAGDAFIQCPLTTDYSAVRLFLDVANADLIPTPGTDFGAAFQTALKAFDTQAEDEAARTQALLIVSDGENHVAGIDALLGQAREAGLVVFTAGVGETEGTPIPVYRNGRRTGYKRDREGRVVSTRLEERALRELAAEGAYFRVARTSSNLATLPEALERLDKTEFGVEEFETYEEQYQWPLALALLLLLAERALPDTRRSRRARSLEARSPEEVPA